MPFDDGVASDPEGCAVGNHGCKFAFAISCGAACKRLSDMTYSSNIQRSSGSTNCPEVDFDPWADDMLKDPFSSYEKLRAISPVVKLRKYGCWAVLDYDPIVEALNDHERFSSAAGVGIDNFSKVKPWRPKSIILETDPPEHDRARRVLTRVLSLPAMEKLRADFTVAARSIVGGVVARGNFDGVSDLAERFPLAVFPDAVGLGKEGRENLLPYGMMVFNAQGPRNEVWTTSMRNADAVTAWIMGQCSREALAPGSLGSTVYEAADTGEITEHEAGMLVRSLLSAGLDTTINGIASALFCFSAFPKQWQLLREKPNLVRSAINEVLRFQGAVMNFFRTTTQDVALAGVPIPAGEKLLVLFAAGNRDPKRWESPDEFLIERDARGHLGFGWGVHKCVGQMVARIELEIVLAALLDRVERLELTGEPKTRLNNSLRGFESVPLSVVARY